MKVSATRFICIKRKAEEKRISSVLEKKDKGLYPEIRLPSHHVPKPPDRQKQDHRLSGRRHIRPLFFRRGRIIEETCIALDTKYPLKYV